MNDVRGDSGSSGPEGRRTLAHGVSHGRTGANPLIPALSRRERGDREAVGVGPVPRACALSGKIRGFFGGLRVTEWGTARGRRDVNSNRGLLRSATENKAPPFFPWPRRALYRCATRRFRRNLHYDWTWNREQLTITRGVRIRFLWWFHRP